MKPVVWLTRRLERVSRRPPMNRYDKALKDDVVVYGWRVALVGFSFALAFFYFVNMAGVSLLIGLPVVLVVVLFVGTVIEHDGYVLVVEHMKRLTRNAPRRNRLRLAPPVERMAPVATADCGRCHVERGKRHDRDCPTVPAGWFNNPRKVRADKR